MNTLNRYNPTDLLTISRTSRISGKKDFLKVDLYKGLSFQKYRNLAPLMHRNDYIDRDPVGVLIELGYQVSWLHKRLYVYKMELSSVEKIDSSLNKLAKL